MEHKHSSIRFSDEKESETDDAAQQTAEVTLTVHLTNTQDFFTFFPVQTSEVTPAKKEKSRSTLKASGKAVLSPAVPKDEEQPVPSPTMKTVVSFRHLDTDETTPMQVGFLFIQSYLFFVDSYQQ